MTGQKVASSGVFEFRFDRFENPLARDQDGHCCSNSSSSSVSSSSASSSAACSSTCRIFFRVCLKHYQNNIDTDTPCTFGEVTTPVLGDNGIKKPGYIVPIFFNFSWPVSSYSYSLTRLSPTRARQHVLRIRGSEIRAILSLPPASCTMIVFHSCPILLRIPTHSPLSYDHLFLQKTCSYIVDIGHESFEGKEL